MSVCVGVSSVVFMAFCPRATSAAAAAAAADDDDDDDDDNTPNDVGDAMSHHVVSFMRHAVIQRDGITAIARLRVCVVVSDHTAIGQLSPAGGNSRPLEAVT